MQQTILYAILAIITLEYLLERTLSHLNGGAMKKELPVELKGIYDDEKYASSQAYSVAKNKFGFYSSTVSFVFTFLMIVFGGYAWIDTLVSQWSDQLMYQALMFFAIIAFISDVIGIPFEWYNTFVIEEKFGFNKMKIGTFIGDKIKGWVLFGLIGGGLLAAFTWFYESQPEYFWLYGWIIIMTFMVLMAAFYTNLIVPVFNKLTPLADGELRTQIEEYASKVKFPLKNIMVVDGSKRSTKANAYFSGLGGQKNIVLYDTLIEKLTTDEIVAVLAHEVGHYKKKHTMQMIAINGINMFITLYLLSLMINMPELSQALGAEDHKFYLGLLTFSLLYSPISVVTGLLMNVFSRKNEFEADEYATITSSAKPLVKALKKLSVDSLSNLTPHPAYVFFHYSHPPLLQRMNAMEKVESAQ